MKRNDGQLLHNKGVITSGEDITIPHVYLYRNNPKLWTIADTNNVDPDQSASKEQCDPGLHCLYTARNVTTLHDIYSKFI